MQHHPASSVFPMMSDVELQVLADDIRQVGLREPIVTFEENVDVVILDGRNRARACELAGVTPTYKPFEGADPYAYVVSANLKRRHLSVGERAAIANTLATLKRGANQFTKVDAPAGASIVTPRKDRSSIGASQDYAAKLLGVGRGSVQRARVVQEKGIPELNDALRAGAVKVRSAAEVARRPKDEQKAFVEQLKAPKETRKKGTGGRPRDEAKYAQIRALMEQGLTTTDIVNKTGIDRRFVIHVKSRIAPRKNILANIILEAEVFAESWLRCAEDLDPRWKKASRADFEQLIHALHACGAAVAKAIHRLNKEAKGMTP